MRMFFLLLFLVSGWGVTRIQAQTSKESHNGGYSRYVTFLPPLQIDSVLQYARTDVVPVIYKVNKYTLYPSAQTDSIVSLIERIHFDDRVKLAYIWIGGSASPEGPVRWNKQLGEYRSKALADYLLANTSLSEKRLRVENLAEDWESVVSILQGSDFPHRDEILAIITNERDWDKRKQQIRAIDGGHTWAQLVRTVFPSFRNSRMVIVCVDQPAPMLAPVSRVTPRPIEMPPFQIPVLPSPPAERVILLKSNLLAVAVAGIANLGIEVELFPKWSLDIPVYYSPYDLFKETRKIRVLATQPELRYWFRNVSSGHFVGLHTHVAGFNISINNHGRYQDPNHALWGMGMSYGYALPFGKDERWGVEFNVGFGFANYQYDRYENIGINSGQKIYSSGDKWYWGVTRAAVNLSYKWSIKKKQGRRAQR